MSAASSDAIAGALEAGEYVWLNIADGRDDAITAAGRALGLHPLTVDGLKEFNQRAKVEDFGDYVYIVAFSASTSEQDDDRLTEVHIVFAPGFLASVANEPVPVLEQLVPLVESRDHSPHELLHSVLDALVDTYGPLFDAFDGEIEQIEELLISRELKGRELEIHELRRRLARVDRVVHRQLESFTSIREMLRRMPGYHADDFPYFRDLLDHLTHVSESADAMRERVAGLFELYMAALDNRQNVIMKQFTVIAGIFLPLSVLTGFFGMNFGWMVRGIESNHAFLILGVALPIVILAGLVVVFAGRGLFRD
jgi:magnesium transporter